MRLRAGEAQIKMGRASITEKLDQDTIHLAIGLPLENSHDWNSLKHNSNQADLITSLTGLVLQQAFPLRRVAAYARNRQRANDRWTFIHSIRVPGPATFSQTVARGIEGVLNALLNDEGLSSQVQLALRWYEKSKGFDEPADRYLALWVSLDALVGGPGRGIIERIETTMKGVVSTTDSELTLKLVDVRLMGNLRNRIAHGTLRNIDPLLSDYKAPPDWVQLLDDLVGEVLRNYLKTTQGDCEVLRQAQDERGHPSVVS